MTIILDILGENNIQMSSIKTSINTHKQPIVLSNTSSPSTEHSPNTNTYSGMK